MRNERAGRLPVRARPKQSRAKLGLANRKGQDDFPLGWHRILAQMGYLKIASCKLLLGILARALPTVLRSPIALN